MWLGWGGFNWRSVLSLVPGIWEAPSLKDLPRRREGEEGRPIMAAGAGLTVTRCIANMQEYLESNLFF